MGKFLKKLVMVVKVAKIALRIAMQLVEVLDSYATKLSEQHAY
jgi:hypothetical protein